MDVFVGIMALDEGLHEVAQVLDEAVACLLPTNPIQGPTQQDPTQDPLPYLVYNSDSEPDSDNELDPDLPWREVQLREARWNQQPTENDSFSLQNTTSPPSLIDSYDRDGMQGDWVSCVSPYGPDTQWYKFMDTDHCHWL